MPNETTTGDRNHSSKPDMIFDVLGLEDPRLCECGKYFDAKDGGKLGSKLFCRECWEDNYDVPED